MMKFSDLSERQVRRSLAKLEEVHLIHIDRQPGRSSSYTLLDVGGAKLAGVPKSMQGGAKKQGGVVPNSGYEQELNNNNYLTKDNEKIKKPVSPKVLKETRAVLVKKGVIPR